MAFLKQLAACALFSTSLLLAQTPSFPIVSIGDSLGEGVQSGDANVTTQRYSYANIVNAALGIRFAMPLIESNALGVVGSVDDRSRIDPNLLVANLAVSGATVGDLLRDASDGVTDAEIDLVMQPYHATQIRAAEVINSSLILCWIGSNDALQAVTSFSEMNATQLTPVAEFQADYNEMVQRLSAAGRLFVMANLPDVDKIAFLVGPEDLVRFLGNDFGLPAGHKTSAIELLLLKSGFDDGSNLSDPNYVLDPAEQAAIQQRIDEFNLIIAQAAASVGMPVVDVNAAFDELVANPPTIGGATLRTNYLGGLFSLDGVHPSNIGNALIANLFLETINDFWGTSLPLLTPDILNALAQGDPFVDHDGDGSVPGRPFTSLLETLALLAGFSGDSSNSSALAAPTADAQDLVRQSRSALQSQSGKSAITEKEAVTRALARAFGVEQPN